jgi:hypothetical protein
MESIGQPNLLLLLHCAKPSAAITITKVGSALQAAHRLTLKASEYAEVVNATQNGRATFGFECDEMEVPIEIAHKLAEKREKGLAKAHNGYKDTKEKFISSVLSDAKAIYEVYLLTMLELNQICVLCPS